MAKDLYDFGGSEDNEPAVTNTDGEESKEKLNNEGVANPEDTNGESEGENLNEDKSKENTSEDIESDKLNQNDIQPENKENNESENTGTESEIDIQTDELDQELKDLEDILNGTGDDSIKPEDNNSEVSDKLKDAVTKMKSLVTKIDKLELENAELTKFGDSAGLSPELIIIKANYNKAMKGDKAAKNKIKELISNDLGLDVTDQKQVFVSNAISSGTDVNTSNNNEDNGFGFVM